MTPVHCAILGMDAQTSYTYDYFFRKFGEGRYDLTNVAETAQVLLIDIDTPEGRRLAQPHLAHREEGRVVVVISANASHPDHVLLLQKPVSSITLRDVLDKATSRLRERSSAPPQPETAPPSARKGDAVGVATAALAMEDEDFNHYMFRFDAAPGGGASKEMFFDPDEHLYGALVQAWRMAQEQGSMMELRWQLPSIRLCPVEKHIYTGMTDKVMRSVAVTHTPTQIVPLEGDAACWPPGAHTEPIETVLWRLAAWTSRGRLPTGTDLSARVRLKRWPNMTRLLPTPHAMQIAALWTSGAYTLQDTAKRLMTSVGDVHVFYCSALALGLLEINHPASGGTPTSVSAAGAAHSPSVMTETVASEEKSASANRGLLSRILGRLLSR